jgi:hypothetical protein
MGQIFYGMYIYFAENVMTSSFMEAAIWSST